MSLRLINIARTALLTQRAALDVVGHNTANAATDGYVRQDPLLAAIPGALGAQGGGVELEDLRLLRDRFLAAQICYEGGNLGREQGLAEALDRVEALFSPDLGDGGLVQRLSEMFDAWAALGLDPTGAAARAQVVERAQLAAQAIAERADALSELRVECDRRLADLVERANSLALELAAINREVGAAPDPSTRNDLITRRDTLVAELAELCGAEAIPGGHDTADVLLGGRRIVQGDRVIPLELVDDPAQPGLHQVALGGQAPPDGLRGQMAGQLSARDQVIPRYLEALDSLAHVLADELNAVHTAGFDLNGGPAPPFFEYDPARPAASLQVTADIIADPARIGAATAPSLATDGANALAIEDLRNQRIFAGGSATASEFCADLIAGVGIDAQAAQTRVHSRALLAENLQARYRSQGGVSLDAEALELIRYQQAYTAASRLVSAALEMMDSILQLR